MVYDACMRIKLHAEAIGYPQALAYDTDASRFDDRADDCEMELFGPARKHAAACLDDALALEGRSLSLLPPDRFVAMMRECGVEPEAVPWNSVMPAAEYSKHLKRIAGELTEATCDLDMSYYKNVFLPGTEFLLGLKPARVDRLMLKNASLKHPHLFSSFHCGSDGYLPVPVYDRFQTRTGRLIVKDGPNVLTMPKEDRNLFVSRHTGGRVVMVDFKAFEVNVMLAMTGTNLRGDVYSLVNHELFSDRFERAQIKPMVLGKMFGMTHAGFAKQTGLHGNELAETIALIEDFFGISKLERRLADDFDGKSIRSFYGRRVLVPDARLLMNSYVQSTAVDAALLGFLELSDRSNKGHLDVEPLFVIHDACVFDVPPNDLEGFSKLANRCPIRGFEREFDAAVTILG